MNISTYRLELLKIAMIQPPSKMITRFRSSMAPKIAKPPMPKSIKGGTMQGMTSPTSLLQKQNFSAPQMTMKTMSNSTGKGISTSPPAGG